MSFFNISSTDLKEGDAIAYGMPATQIALSIAAASSLGILLKTGDQTAKIFAVVTCILGALSAISSFAIQASLGASTGLIISANVFTLVASAATLYCAFGNPASGTMRNFAYGAAIVAHVVSIALNLAVVGTSASA